MNPDRTHRQASSWCGSAGLWLAAFMLLAAAPPGERASADLAVWPEPPDQSSRDGRPQRGLREQRAAETLHSLGTVEILEWLKRSGAEYTVYRSDEGVRKLHVDTGERILTEEDWDRIHQLRHLAALSIGGPGLIDRDLARLQQIRRLEALGLQQASAITDAGLAHLADLKLQRLMLDGTRVTDAGCKHLAGMTALEHLSLERTNISGPGLRHLQDLPKLRELHLWSNPVTDDSLESLRVLVQLERLAVLWNPQLDGSFLRHLRTLDHLDEVNLRHSGITDAGLEAAGPLPQVSELTLDSTHVSDTGLRHLRGWVALKTLHLHGGQVTREGARQLAGLASLEELWLRAESTTQRRGGAPERLDGALDQLRHIPQLQRVGLSSRVTPQGMAHLASLPNLVELKLAGVPLDGEMLDTLAASRSMRALTLAGSGYDDALLAQLVKLGQIEALALDGTGVTDIGLVSLRHMHSLQVLTLSDDTSVDAKITQDGLQRLRRARPELEIRLEGQLAAVHELQSEPNGELRQSTRRSNFQREGR